MAVLNVDTLGLSDDALSVVNFMQGVLDRLVAVYAAYGMPLPARRYWTMGTPALDCEQAVVNFVQMYLGPPGDEASTPQRCNSPRTAVIEVSVARQVPVVGDDGKPPSAAEIQKASKALAVDAWIMMASLELFDQWEPDGMLGLGVIATLNTPEPEGGFQRTVMQLTMAVP